MDKKIDILMQDLQNGRMNYDTVRAALVTAYNSGYSEAKKGEYRSGYQDSLANEIEEEKKLAYDAWLAAEIR